MSINERTAGITAVAPTPPNGIPLDSSSGGFGHPSSGRGIRNSAATVVVYACFLLAVVPLVWILWTVISRGFEVVATSTWWTNSQRGLTSIKAGGGAYHAIIGTLMEALVCAAIAVPIGIFTAVYLVEYGRGRLARVISFMVDILTGIPSIVAALFVYALWVSTLGFERVPIAVSLALVLLMIPVVVRSTEEMLKLVPNELREASYALGVAKWKTIASIVLPTAFSGILTGILLGLARVMGETAPLLILGPYAKSINFDVFSGYLATLPTMINYERTEFTDAAVARTWAAALTLILLIMLLSIAARLIARFSSVRP
jgi:phosphate transport system permease protein